MKYKIFILVIGIALLVPMQAIAEKTGKTLSDTCLGCHGLASYTNVYPSYKVPKLAGQHKDYLVAALQSYRVGQRKHPTMMTQAGRLSDQDITNIAEYFSKLESAKGNPNAIISKSVQKQAATCVACHSNDGNSLVPTFPRIAGQYESYLYQSLKDYKSGIRNNPIMLGIVATLSDHDMKVLSKYFASRKGLGTISLPNKRRE